MGGDKVKREGMRERGQSLVSALVTTRREIGSNLFWTLLGGLFC